MLTTKWRRANTSVPFFLEEVFFFSLASTPFLFCPFTPFFLSAGGLDCLPPPQLRKRGVRVFANLSFLFFRMGFVDLTIATSVLFTREANLRLRFSLSAQPNSPSLPLPLEGRYFPPPQTMKSEPTCNAWISPFSNDSLPYWRESFPSPPPPCFF